MSYQPKPHNTKITIFLNALKIAWRERVFKAWIFICSIGIVLGLIAGIGMTQLVLLVSIACIGWAMEIMNTATESVMDIIHPTYSEKVKVVKDLYAAVPTFVFSAYVITWIILVLPNLMRKILLGFGY
jgi:diacylglycerol kinase